MSPTLDTVGPMARTAEDCALMLSVIAGHDRHDPESSEELVPDYLSALSLGLKGLRIGFDRGYFLYSQVTDEVQHKTEAAVEELVALGAEIVPIRIPELDHLAAAGMTVLLADTSEWHRALLRTQPDKYVPATRVMLEVGELVPAAQYVQAQRARAVLRDRVRQHFYMHRLDCLLAPTIPTTTMPVEVLAVDLTGSGETALSAFLHHGFLANVVGLPALSFPCGFSSSDLPVGLQLFGRPFGEPVLFRVAHAYQQGTDWHLRRPEPQLRAGASQ